MSLSNGSNELVMPVSPMYGGGYGGLNGFGGDGWWIILLLLFAGGGWGNGFGGGYGGFGNMMLGYDFPWLLNGQSGINNNTNNGFQNAMLNDNITSVRDGIASLSTQLCNTGNGIQMALANGFAGVEQGANTRQMANMQSMFGIESQLQNCCCENRANIADLKYTVATENCADRQVVSDGVRDIIANQTAGTQRILDQLCADKIDAKNDEIAQLRQEVLYARGQASQIAQNEQIVNSIYNRLDQCPVGTTPVYGRTPIFSCNNNGCGCNGNFVG